MGERKDKNKTERNDEIGDLIFTLKRIRASMGIREVTLTLIDRGTLASLIKALKRVPLPRGNPRRINRDAALREWKAVKILRERKQELIGKGSLAIDAEWQAAEEAVPIFLGITGRKLAVDTIRRIMQRSGLRWPRTAMPKKKRRAEITPFSDHDIVVIEGLLPPPKSRR